MSEKRLFIVRHGNTFDKGDVIRRVGRGTDLPLSDSGRAQADALGKHFADQAICPDLILVSPLQRTQQTADALIAAQPGLPAWQIDPRLNELDYGPDEGMPEAQVIARLGQAALDDWDRHAQVPPGWQVEPGVVAMDWSLLLEDLRNHEAQTIVAVTSNGTARFVLPLCERQSDSSKVDSIKLKTAAFGELALPSDGRPRILRWNERAPARAPAWQPMQGG